MVNYQPYRIYRGEDLLKPNENKSEPLIQDILFENDYIMLVAPPKMGKSILALQMACSLSSGTPFLDTFEVTKAYPVWYFATEGKDEDTKDRLRRISKVTPLNKDNFTLICTVNLQFNTNIGKAYVQSLTEQYNDNLPKVIFIDAVYKGFKGSLKDDEYVNEFHHAIGIFAEKCDAAVVLVHHLPKIQRGDNGEIYEQTGKNAYGSQFFIAAADHVFNLERFKKEPKDKFLRCDEDLQRSGVIVDGIRLRLRQPDPLGFEIIGQYMDEQKRIIEVLREKPLDITDIIRKSEISRSICYIVLKELLNLGKVKKEGRKVKFYGLAE